MTSGLRSEPTMANLPSKRDASTCPSNTTTEGAEEAAAQRASGMLAVGFL